jgi:mevalonate kinase
MKHTATQALVTIAMALAIVVTVKVIQARATEILFAVMNDSAGKTSIHQVNLRDGYCVALVNKFNEQAKQNTTPITLTLPSPTFTGTVIEAYCIMPDGSTNPTFKAPTI